VYHKRREVKLTSRATIGMALAVSFASMLLIRLLIFILFKHERGVLQRPALRNSPPDVVSISVKNSAPAVGTAVSQPYKQN